MDIGSAGLVNEAMPVLMVDDFRIAPLGLQGSGHARGKSAGNDLVATTLRKKHRGLDLSGDQPPLPRAYGCVRQE